MSVDKRGELLLLALTGRNFGIRPSALLEVKDNRIALDFDFACASRLQIYLNPEVTENVKGGQPFLVACVAVVLLALVVWVLVRFM